MKISSNNFIANTVSNQLSENYVKLNKSTERLSTGLRINHAADDAAGLAIRELMRADVAALNQGIRNANDAISMLQTADGALAIIDEKLIRMKELAEQAATGTYDSIQRLMIASEFNAMGSEINRIANATDFNWIKIFDSDLDKSSQSSSLETTGTVIFSGSSGEITDVDNKTYTVSTQNIDITNRHNESATNNTTNIILNDATLANLEGNIIISAKNVTYGIIEGSDSILAVNIDTSYASGNFDSNYFLEPLIFKYESRASGTRPAYYGWYIQNEDARYLGGDYDIVNPDYYDYIKSINYDYWGDHTRIYYNDSGGHVEFFTNIYDINTGNSYDYSKVNGTNDPENFIGKTVILNLKNQNDMPEFTYEISGSISKTGKTTGVYDSINKTLTFSFDLGDGNIFEQVFNLETQPNASSIVSFTSEIEIKNTKNKVSNIESELNSNGAVKIHFGSGNDSGEDYYYISKYDPTLQGLGLSDVNIQTQKDSQQSLVKIDKAIERKDSIRAYYGTMQNRLENTIANLQIQSSNLKTAESRISDTDIATEMADFTRKQILTQTAVAMLAQANSFGNYVKQLIQ